MQIQSLRWKSGAPAKSLMNNNTIIAVQNEIISASTREGGPSGSTRERNCVMKYQNKNVYWPSSQAIKTVFLAALLATPFTVSADMFLWDSHLPMPYTIAAATKLVIIGISTWLVKKFMGLPFAGVLRNSQFKAAGNPAPADTAQQASENVAQGVA